jgi:hypothetical protein
MRNAVELALTHHVANPIERNFVQGDNIISLARTNTNTDHTQETHADDPNINTQVRQ